MGGHDDGGARAVDSVEQDVYKRQQQNSGRTQWPFEETDAKLHQIMVDIHANTVATAEEYGVAGDYVAGANLAGFRKVADAMVAMGLI